jgi:hypothetical protein
MVRYASAVGLSVLLTGVSGGLSFAAASAQTVPLYKVFETAIRNPKTYADPFTGVVLSAEFVAPLGQKTAFWGFYDGDGQGGQTGDVWKLRFMPSEVGTWAYSYAWSDGSAGGSGRFTCVAAGAGKGVLQPYARNTRWLAYQGTAPVFLNMYYVGMATTTPLDWTVAKVYEPLLAAGVNAIQFMGLPTTEYDWIESPTQAWADAPPKLLRRMRDYHLDAWRLAEAHVAWLNDRNVAAFAWSGVGSLSGTLDEAWYRYVCARLAPFANIMWGYFFESAAPDLFLSSMKTYDPFQHLVGSQNLNSFSFKDQRYTFGTVSDRDPAMLDPAVVHRRVLSHWSTSAALFPVCWNEGACWHHEYDTTDVQLRRICWAQATAAGQVCWSWTCATAGQYADRPLEEVRPRLLAADLLKSKADEYLKVLSGVMNQRFPFCRSVPHDDLLADFAGDCFCLADPGKDYLVYKADGGSFRLTLPPGTYAVTWVDTADGSTTNAPDSKATAATQFTAPNVATDWVLLLRRVDE